MPCDDRRVKRLPTASAAALAVLELAACTAPAVPTSTPTAEPSPPRVEDVVSEVRTALPLDCAELYSVEELQPLLVTPVQVRRDEMSPPEGVAGTRFVMAGASYCDIGGTDRTDGSFDQGLSVVVYPDAEADFDTWRAATSFTPDAVFDTVGTKSVVVCSESAESFECLGNFVSAGYWVTARLSDSVPLAPADALPLVGGVFSAIADRVAAAGPPRPLWEPPAEAWDPASLCVDPSGAAALLGVDAGALTARQLPNEVAVGAPGVGCEWTESSTGAFALIWAVRGGAWAFDRFLEQPSFGWRGYYPPGTPVEVPNTDGALIACADGCSGLLSVGGSLVQTFTQTYDQAVGTVQLQEFGTALP